MHTLDVFYLVAVWFFILMLVSKKDRIYSAVLFVFAVFNIVVFDLFDFTSTFNYIEKKEFLIKIDGTLALIMTLVMYNERGAIIQAKILTFMVLCHSMVVLHLINENSYFAWFVSTPLYANYESLIVMAALLQMWVTRNGMAKGLNNTLESIQGMLLRSIFHSNRIYKNLFTRKERESQK